MTAAADVRPATLSPAEPFTPKRLRLVLGTMLMALAWVAVAANKPWSDGRSAAALALAQNALFLAYAAYYRDWQFARLFYGFGLTLGITELIADGLCVQFTRTLDYSPARNAMLGLSPWWMPTAWMMVTTQIGFVGTRLMARLGTARGAFDRCAGRDQHSFL